MTRKRLLLILVVVLPAAAGAALLIWRPWRLPDPAKQSPQQIVQFLSSPQFGQLSEKDRAEYVGRVEGIKNWRNALAPAEWTLDERQQQQLRQNVPAWFPEKADSAVRYFQLPEDQRQAFLDDFIAKLAALRRENTERINQRLATNPALATRPGVPPANWAERARNTFEKNDPADRARQAAFQRALGQRMKETGMDK